LQALYFSFALYFSPVFSRPFFSRHLFKNPQTYNKIKRLLRRLRTKESQKLQKVNIRMGAKRAVMKKRTVTHIQVKIVMKRRNQT
jgi:hypothetical protein